MNANTVRAMLLRNLGREADDPVGSHDMYDDDAVLEFPQSGERFEGVANIREWRSRYPGSVTYDIRRIRGAGDIWVAEINVSYDGGEPHYGVDVLEIRKGKIVRETVYVGEAFDAPEWRAQWRVAPSPTRWPTRSRSLWIMVGPYVRRAIGSAGAPVGAGRRGRIRAR